MRFTHPLLAPALLALLGLAGAAGADDWPRWLGPQGDGVWREKGILEKFPKDGPKVLWRKPIGGGYAGPAVADGRVYVADRVLDPGEKDPSNPFQRTNSKGKERLLCFESATGKLLWERSVPCRYTMSYPCGPRAMPVVADGKVYTLGAMGDLNCYDARSGKPVWGKNLVKEYDKKGSDVSVQIWGFSATPLVDGDNLICLVGKKPAVVAFDKNTGKEKWRALHLESAEIGYCPPTIFTLAGKRQLVIWHPESVNGLDPVSGAVLWSFDWPVKANMTIPTPRQVGNKLFLTGFYCGCKLLEIQPDGNKFKVKELWSSHARNELPEGTDKLHSVMPTPVIIGDYSYGVCSYGQLRCLTLADGKRVWEDLTATGTGGKTVRWGNAFLVPHGERFFLFNEKGDLIIAKLTPKGYTEIDRTHLLAPTGQLSGGGRFGPGRKIVWSHPAFANKTIFVRNDKEIVAVSLAAEK
jgi:outer membrane protein assembly factor BamB